MGKQAQPTIKKKFRAEWCALKNAIDRCQRTNHSQYKDYGGRGIMVDPEFLCPYTGFVTFLADVGAKPHPSLTLERKNNDLGYVKGNLVWVSRAENMTNRRPNSTTCTDLGWGIGKVFRSERGNGSGAAYSPLIPYEGRTQTLSDWALELGLKGATIRQRFYRGLTVEQALDTYTGRAKRTGPTIH
jgi:hypothetical protein